MYDLIDISIAPDKTATKKFDAIPKLTSFFCGQGGFERRSNELKVTTCLDLRRQREFGKCADTLV